MTCQRWSSQDDDMKINQWYTESERGSPLYIIGGTYRRSLVKATFRCDNLTSPFNLQHANLVGRPMHLPHFYVRACQSVGKWEFPGNWVLLCLHRPNEKSWPACIVSGYFRFHWPRVYSGNQKLCWHHFYICQRSDCSRFYTCEGCSYRDCCNSFTWMRTVGGMKGHAIHVVAQLTDLWLSLTVLIQ